MTSAFDLIIHTERMRDGVRRVTEVYEVTGMEGDIVSLGSLFNYRYIGENPDGTLKGVFDSHPVRPRFYRRLDYFGLGEAFMKALSGEKEGRRA